MIVNPMKDTFSLSCCMIRGCCGCALQLESKKMLPFSIDAYY